MNYDNVDDLSDNKIEVPQYSDEIQHRPLLINFWSLSVEVQFYVLSYFVLLINKQITFCMNLHQK